ncbi:phage tail protein [Nocardioides humi]|uniref:Phage tail protein, P2 protein I family n=1 Tax=Nocardioides humi TaxID=449461 RepID=A0ABN2B2L0_9ACTN|nr:phage tail protein [Nocardioides humi]
MADRDAGTPSRRGLVPGLLSPAPVATRLPGVLQDDDLMVRFVSAFDDAYAPVHATLDSLAAYFDPWLAPDDFVELLAGWVGVELDDAWSSPVRRRIIADAALLHRRRGTIGGIVAALTQALGAAEVTVGDSGSCEWSQRPGGATAADPEPPAVAVRIAVTDPDEVDVRRVEALLEAVCPAHVAHRYEVVGLPGAGGAS